MSIDYQGKLTSEVLAELRKPFPASRISFKCQTKPSEKGNSLVVAYIDARDVMDRLDEVVGPDWSTRYEWISDRAVMCYLSVCGVTRADGSGQDNDNEPVKSAVSDAFKRAAVHFGVGRFLYDLPKMWGKARPAGKGYVLEEGEIDRLRRVVDNHVNGRKPRVPTPAGSVRPESCTVQPEDASAGRGPRDAAGAS